MPIDMNMPPEEAALNIFRQPIKVIEEIVKSKPNYGLSFIESTNLEKETSHEFELLGNVFKHGDVYGLIVHDDKTNTDFYLIRGQFIPVKLGNLGLGITARRLDGTNFPAHSETGGVARISGNLPNGFAQIDFRYFPGTNTTDIYGFMSPMRKMTADFLASYNDKMGNGSVRLGASYNLAGKVSVGVRNKFLIEKQGFTKKSLRESAKDMHLYLKLKF